MPDIHPINAPVYIKVIFCTVLLETSHHLASISNARGELEI